MAQDKNLSNARNYCLRLIKFRLRSEKELRDKLKAKSYEASLIEEVVTFLKQARILDDELFAKLWIESRIKKPLGLLKLRQELEFKGIDKNIIDCALNRIKENYDEENVIYDIVQTKMQRMKNVDPNKMKSRLFSYLVRRGYSRNLVIDAILKSASISKDEDMPL